jgi:hypothetical protein
VDSTQACNNNQGLLHSFSMEGGHVQLAMAALELGQSD